MASSFLETARDILKNNISEIGTVYEWAEKLGYSRRHFVRLIKQEAEIYPKQLLREANLQKLEELLAEDPETKAVVLAQEIGFPSTQGLYQYLLAHRNCTISEFREQVTGENS